MILGGVRKPVKVDIEKDLESSKSTEKLVLLPRSTEEPI